MMLSDYFCEKSHKHKQQTGILKISHLPYARQQVNFTCMLLVLPFTDLSNATIEIRLPGVFICYCQESHKQTQQNFICMFHCIHAFVVIETNNASLCCQKRTTFLELSLKHISVLHDHIIDFCVVKVFVAFLETRKSFSSLRNVRE